MSEPADRTPATSFGRAAAAYTRGRPEYPPAAVEWLLPPPARRVADVGAGTGTGKLSGAIARTGRTVVAVDPDPDMLAALVGRHPGIRALPGTGESIPLPDGSVDAVTFGQAWHWVDPALASPEAARVLTPGGVLGLVWNLRDDAVPWVRELSAVMRPSAAEQLKAAGGPTVEAPFGPCEHHQVPWVRTMSHDDVLAMASSRSYLITASDAERTRVLGQIRDLLASHPGTAGRPTVDLPYVTHVYRATRP